MPLADKSLRLPSWSGLGKMKLKALARTATGKFRTIEIRSASTGVIRWVKSKPGSVSWFGYLAFAAFTAETNSLGAYHQSVMTRITCLTDTPKHKGLRFIDAAGVG
jgi:hypothetical protein